MCCARGAVSIEFSVGEIEDALELTLNPLGCDLAALEIGKGTIRLAGDFTRENWLIRCIADIDLDTFQGSGRLELITFQP